MEDSSDVCLVRLNVGGTRFETTARTLKSCKHFGDLGDAPVFLDRDADVFRRALKVLRGYPCDGLADDLEVISELAWLQHVFLEATLPAWVGACVRHVETEDANHILDPEQTARFSRTRMLVSSDAVARLHAYGVLNNAVPDYPKCRVVGVNNGWVDSQWVPIHDFEVAKMRLRFLRQFLPHRLVDDEGTLDRDGLNKNSQEKTNG